VPMVQYLKSGDIPEINIQKCVMDWVRLNPSISNLIIHFPNEGKRTFSFGKSLKNLGLRKGVSDLFIAMPRHGFGGAWIELKSRNGFLTKYQKLFLKDMDEQNFFTKVCYCIDDTIETIKWYCSL